MPFKTKKHKKSADERRISISEQGLAAYKSAGNESNKIDANTSGRQSTISKYSGESYKYVRLEITTILILSLLIIGLQIFLRISDITF